MRADVLAKLKAGYRYNPETGQIVGPKGRPLRPLVNSARHCWMLQFNVNGKSVNIKWHRAAWALMTGDVPPPEIDHKNGDWADNRWENLRAATHSENMRNVLIKRKSALPVGVYLSHNVSKPYRAICGRKHVGYFRTASEAESAYRQAAALILGEFAGIHRQSGEPHAENETRSGSAS